MEAVMTPQTAEQPLAPNNNNNNNNKQIRIKTANNPKRNGGRGNFISYPSPFKTLDAYAAATGLLNPPPRAMSFSHQQPPLLPLPGVSSIHHHRHQPLLSRSLSCTQGLSSRADRTRDTSLTPKKSKPTKREEAKRRSATQSISEYLMVASSGDNRWGPDPKDLPKHLPVVLTSKVLEGKGLAGTVSVENMDTLLFSSSGSVVLSPPPSSLPLPKFSLRSKLSCNAEAAGVDAGATNNLRRLLRLR